MKRAKILTDSLHKNPIKGQHLTHFMGKIFIEGHVEPVPALTKKQECWYLPLFRVNHPKKHEQVQGVFDSYENISIKCSDVRV